MSFADDEIYCNQTSKKNIDLTSYFDGQRDQGPAGWCTGHVKADLKTYHLKKNNLIGAGEQLSGEAISIRDNNKDREGRIRTINQNKYRFKAYNQLLRDTNRQIDEVERALNVTRVTTNNDEESIKSITLDLQKLKVMKNRYEDIIDDLMARGFEGEDVGGKFTNSSEGYLCLESDLTSYKDFIMRLENEAFDILSLETPMSLSQKSDGNNRYKLQFDLLSFPRTDRHLLCRQSMNLSHILNNLTVDEIFQVIVNQEIVDPLQELYKKNCQKKFPINLDPRYFSRANNSKQQILNKINEMLDRETPLYLTYSTKIFKDKEFVTNPLVDSSEEDSIYHASSLVGKKYNCQTEQYDYILKNTWGDYGCERKKSKMIKSLWQDDVNVRTDISMCIRQKWCDSKGEIEKEICEMKCETEKYSSLKGEHEKTMFSCTSNGYFIVPAELLARGMRGVGHYDVKMTGVPL